MAIRIEFKIREAEFFFRLLSEEDKKFARNEPEAFLYYLSAFLTAARSATEVGDYDFGKTRWPKWYDAWVAKRSAAEAEILNLLTDQRNKEVHRKGAEVDDEIRYFSLFEMAILEAGTRDRSHPAYGVQYGGPPGTPPPMAGKPEFKIGGKPVIPTCRDVLDVLAVLRRDVLANPPDPK